MFLMVLSGSHGSFTYKYSNKEFIAEHCGGTDVNKCVTSAVFKIRKYKVQYSHQRAVQQQSNHKYIKTVLQYLSTCNKLHSITAVMLLVMVGGGIH